MSKGTFRNQMSQRSLSGLAPRPVSTLRLIVPIAGPASATRTPARFIPSVEPHITTLVTVDRPLKVLGMIEAYSPSRIAVFDGDGVKITVKGTLAEAKAALLRAVEAKEDNEGPMPSAQWGVAAQSALTQSAPPAKCNCGGLFGGMPGGASLVAAVGYDLHAIGCPLRVPTPGEEV